MKRHLLKGILCLLTGALAIDASAQSAAENVVPYKSLAPEHTNASALRSSSVVACGTDTILYPYLKELVFTAPNDSFFIDAMVGSVRTASQAYHLNDAVNISGVQFWGAAYSTSTQPQTLQVKAYLYSVDAMNMPVAVLDSAVVTITEQYDFYEAYFTTPYNYNQNFAVAVRSNINDTLAVITNNAGNTWATNYGEGLAWRRFGSGSWNSSMSFFGQDLEYMIFPIVDYSVTTSFTGPATVCENTSASFTNTSSPLYGNRFFNLYAFDDYWMAASDSTFEWNYGDSPAWTTSVNGSHTYSTTGTYNVKLKGEMLGYYTSCIDSMEMAVNIVAPTSSFIFDASMAPTVSFTNTSTGTGTTTYMWDFGDSNTSTAQDPTHTYSGDGTYTVTLTITDSCGTETSTQTVTISTVGMNEAGSVNVNAFYNAQDQELRVSVPASANTRIEVYDVLGNLIYAESGVSTSTKVISLNGLATGTYMVRVSTANGVGAAKFAVIK